MVKRTWCLGLVLSCGGPPAVEVIEPPRPAAADPGAASRAPEAAPARRSAGEVVLADDCAGLAASAAAVPEDAALLLWLCPEVQPGPSALRGALLLAASPLEAADLAPRLGSAPDLAGLARLAALDRVAGLPAEVPDPLTAPVSPIDAAVLASVVRAIGAQTASGLSHEQRTRAMAYLARAHHEALAQLGLPLDQALPPFGRLLAGRFLHFGRMFCQMYWQRRVAGLEGLFAATEAQLLRTVLALERSPHAGDDAVLAVERQRARRHLQGGGVAERLAAKGVAETPAELRPLLNELDRLLDHGFVELAIQRALFLAGEQPGSLGLGPVVEALTGALAQRDLGEYRALLDRRVAEARALQPPPPEHGTKELPPRQPVRGTDAATVAAAADAWLQAAEQASGFARRHGLGRAALLLRERPDATRELLRRALLGAERRDGVGVRIALGLLERQEGESLAGLRVRAAADPRAPDGDAAVRRAFALASRDAGLLPR